MTTIGLWKIGIPLATALAFSGGVGMAAESRFEIDLKELPKAAAPPAKSVHAPPAASGKPRSTARKVATEGTARYTVKPGDHIFKILMRDFGLSNRQAELLIPDIARLNGISDIRRLRVGQELLIPLTPSARSARKSLPTTTAGREPSPQPSPVEVLPADSHPAPAPPPPPPVPEPVSAAPAAAATPPPGPRAVSAPEPPAVPSVPEKPSRVVICPVTAKERDGIVDALLDLMAPGWVRNRIVEGGKESTDGSYVSIKVGRYFEYLGYRYIVNSESDPLTLTLLRLLEVQGDRVVNVGRDEGVADLASRLASKMELPQQEGSFRVKCLDPPGVEALVRGIRIAPAGPYGQQMLITGDQVQKCTAELLTGEERPLAGK